MKNKNIHIILLYVIILVLVGVVISNRNLIFDNNKIILKNMDESTQLSDKEKAIDDLNTSLSEYENYITTSKTNLAKAITNAGVATSGTDSLETMIINVSKIVSTKTNDATATEDSILSGKTAYVKGSKVTGTMANNGAWTSTPTTSTKVTIPAGYHNGLGYVDTSKVYTDGYNTGKSSIVMTLTQSRYNITLDVSNYSSLTFTRTTKHPYSNLYIQADGNNIYTCLAGSEGSETKSIDISSVSTLRIYTTFHTSYYDVAGHQLSLTIT